MVQIHPPLMDKKQLFLAKEALSLALFQLEDHRARHEDIDFAYENVETVLEEIVKTLQTWREK